MGQDARALGLLQLREDPQYRRIPAGHRAPLVAAALQDAHSMADVIADRWGSDPVQIAARCAVPVIHSEADAGFASVIVYAQYCAGPRTITLYLPAIRQLDRLVAQNDGRYGALTGATMPIFLAHELYHHFDCLRGSQRLNRRHAVTIFRVGPWRWTSGLSSLCEIAAGAFAQRLLGLSFHPKLLDFLSIQTLDHADYADNQGPCNEELRGVA